MTREQLIKAQKLDSKRSAYESIIIQLKESREKVSKMKETVTLKMIDDAIKFHEKQLQEINKEFDEL